MEQKTPIGERCALTTNNSRYFILRLFSLLAVSTIMCLYAAKQASAQQAEPAAAADIQPLQIGDTIPEWLWHHPLQVLNHPEGKDIITLHDYRGKLIILDFWATWCSACLESFPRMDGLKEKFGDQLSILLVNAKQTGDDIGRVKKTFEVQRAGGYEVKLPSAVADSVLQRLFPHWILPHYVWISPKGQFRLTTFSREITDENVYSVIQDLNTKIHIKQDVLNFDVQSTSLTQILDSLGTTVK